MIDAKQEIEDEMFRKYRGNQWNVYGSNEKRIRQITYDVLGKKQNSKKKPLTNFKFGR